MSNTGWIGVDLDGTLARYDGWKGADNIGEPIKPMVDRVKQWLAEGKTVKIFTARVYCPPEPDVWEFGTNGKCDWLERKKETVAAESAIGRWCLQHIGAQLPVTCVKDFGMIELWDDRAVQVVTNTGHTLEEIRAAIANA